jgi:tyrosine-protein phosphatase YwqE
MELGAAAEYFIDEHFVQELKEKKPLLTLKDNLVLVEFSMVTAPFDLGEVLFELQLQNYQPVIAHPERYIYLRNKKAFFDELKEHGCYFQLNLLSLVGHYGASVQELAEYLVKKDHYDFAGTDMHSERHLALLQKLSLAPYFTRLKASEQIKNHLL